MKHVFFLLCFLSLSSMAGTSDPRCQLSSGGYVGLIFDVNATENQVQQMTFLVGKENDWERPYEVRKLCENVLKEILSPIGEKWEENCLYDGIYLVRSLGLGITAKGASLLGLSSPEIWFNPIDHRYFDERDGWIIPALKIHEAYIKYSRANDPRRCGTN